MEDRGIDEVYVDFDAVPGELTGDGAADYSLALAERMQHAVFASTGLTCSIGVAPNKLLAKIASELNKPNGITIVHQADLAAKIWALPCRRINGVGSKGCNTTRGAARHTIGELAQCEARLADGAFWPPSRRLVARSGLGT